MSDKNLIDWTMAPAPDLEEAPPAPSGLPAGAPEARPALAHRRLSRHTWLLLGTLVVLTLLLTAAFPRLEVWRTQGAVEQVIAQQEQARLAGDWAALRGYYSAEPAGWAEAQVQYLRGQAPAGPFGLAGTRLDQQAGQVRQVQAVGPLTMRADVVREYVLADGTRAHFGLPQYYQYEGGAWRQVPAPEPAAGDGQILHGARVDIHYTPAEAGLATSLAADLDALLDRACADWNCPADLRVPVAFGQPGGHSGGPDSGLADTFFGSLTFDALLSHDGPPPWLTVLLPSSQTGLYPADAAATDAVRREAGAQALIIVAQQLSGAPAAFTDVRPFLYALVVRELVRLGIEDPRLDEVRVTNPLFLPGQMWRLPGLDFETVQALPEALVLLNAVLEGRNMAEEPRLLRTVVTAPDPLSWLGSGLGLTPDVVEALLVYGLNPPFPRVQSPAFAPDLALSCPSGPLLATLAGRTAPLLAGDFPGSVAGPWSPDGARLALAISGRPGVVDLASGTGQWLPAPTLPNSQLGWATNKVLAYHTSQWVGNGQGGSLGRASLIFFDAADPERALPSIPGFGDYVPAPDQSSATLGGDGASSGPALSLIPALGGLPRALGDGYGAAWAPDSGSLIFATSDATKFSLQRFDLATGATTVLLTSGLPPVPYVPAGTTWTNLTAAWNPAGDRLAVTVDTYLYDRPSGWVGLLAPDGSGFRVLGTAAPDSAPVTASFSADGRYLAVGLLNGSAPAGVEIYTLAGGIRLVPDALSASWSPTGHILALAGAAGVALLREPGDANSVPQAIGPRGCDGLAWK